MKLHEVFPLEELQARYPRPITVEQLGLDAVNQLSEIEPGIMLGLGLHAWHRMLQSEDFSHLGEDAMAGYASGPVLGFLGMLDTVAGPLFHDFSCTVCKNDDGQLVGRVVVADLCPNDLHIADIYFQNPDQPLTAEERKYADQKCKGFGLLGTVLNRVERFAAENGNSFVTLVAASESRVALFERFDYCLAPDEKGRRAHAMLKTVAR